MPNELNFAERNAVKVTLLTLLAVIGPLSVRGATVDVYSSADLHAKAQALLKKRTQFASEDLARYGNHYMLLAARDRTGSAEVHEHEADVFVVQGGTATLVTGGKIVGGHTQKPGEIRGSSIEGGERRKVGTGDIIHIPAGVPHQILVEAGPFTYFVVKVTGQ